MLNCHRDPGHHVHVFKNNSGNSVVAAYLFKEGNDKCILDGTIILPEGAQEFQAPECCWENDPFEIYIIEAYTYDNSEFTDCDSLYIDYDILGHWVLQPDQLKALNYTITFQ